MSSLKLKHSGGNSVSIAAPSSNPAADRTLTVDGSADGNIVPSNYGNFFKAYSSGATTVATSTTTTIIPNTEVYDVGSAYNTSTGKFTPNVAGYYWVKAHVMWATTSSATNNKYYTAMIFKNTTEVIKNIIHIDKQDWWSSVPSGLVEMNGSSDYLQLKVWHNRGGDEYTGGDAVYKTHFEAHWVRAL